MPDSKSSDTVRPASRPARRRLHREAESSPPATRRRSRTRRLAGTRRSFFWPSLTGSMRCPSGRMAHPGLQIAVSHPVVGSPWPVDWSRLRGSSCGLVSHRRNAAGVRSIPPREHADAGRPTLPPPVESSAERLTRTVIWSVRSGPTTSVRSQAFLVQFRHVAGNDALVLHGGRDLLGRKRALRGTVDPRKLTCKSMLAYHLPCGHLSRDR